MRELYETILDQWAKKLAEERKYRAKYHSTNDYDYLSYAQKAETEVEKLDRVLKTMEEDL
jgi:hypothetical protein